RQLAANIFCHSDRSGGISYCFCFPALTMLRDVSASLDMTTKIDKAVVLAAGRGTRMRELTAEVPKPMIQVRGKPVLQHIIEGLRDAGVRDFLIVVGHHADAVQNFFGDGSRYNTAIQYAMQTVKEEKDRDM